MKKQAILLVGATSSVARALAVLLAQQGARLHLVGRDMDEVERIARDLQVRYHASVSGDCFEAEDYATHAEVLRKAQVSMGRLDGVIVAIGFLGDQEHAQRDGEQVQRIIQANYMGAVSILTYAANHLEAQRSGFIVGISSVAGDRGRQSNYVYGSAKGAFSLFLQGLRNRLSKAGVHVMTVKPGFLDTKMTFGQSGLFLVASPEKVARAILRALHKRKNTLYTPWFWRGVMLIIRAIPEQLFRRMSL